MRNLLIAFITLLIGTVPATAQDSDGLVQVRGDVYYQASEDPFGDQGSVEAILVQGDTQREGIVFRCDPNNADERDIFVAGNYFGDDSRPVQWRFDDGEVYDESWAVSSEGTAAFVPDSRETSIVEGARQSGQLAVRVTDYDYTRHTYVFDLTGFEDALERMNSDCLTPQDDRRE